MREFRFSAQTEAPIGGSPEAVFAFLDDHRNLSGHMEQKSWMMMGSRMAIHLEEGGTARVGARFGFEGSFFGVPLSVEEEVTERRPPRLKIWETSAEPQLWVIGRYRMGFETAPRGASSTLRVFIQYDLPSSSPGRWLGRLLSGAYARWCTRRMAEDASRHFAAGPLLPPGT